MERENELEDEVEKYQKMEKQWNEKRERIEAKTDALSAKVHELEALIASNETKVSICSTKDILKVRTIDNYNHAENSALLFV